MSEQLESVFIDAEVLFTRELLLATLRAFEEKKGSCLTESEVLNVIRVLKSKLPELLSKKDDLQPNEFKVIKYFDI